MFEVLAHGENFIRVRNDDYSYLFKCEENSIKKDLVIDRIIRLAKGFIETGFFTNLSTLMNIGWTLSSREELYDDDDCC